MNKRAFTVKAPVMVVLLLTVMGFAASGCQKTQIDEMRPVALGAQKLAEPRVVLVVPFKVAREDIKLDSDPIKRTMRKVGIIDSSNEESKLMDTLSQNMAKGMVDEFQKAGYQARLVGRDVTPGAGVLVVDGTFTSVDAGNTAQRTMIGFGAGGAKVKAETRVVYMDGATPVEVMKFQSNGESMKRPGAAVTLGGSAVVTGVSGAAAESGNNAEGLAKSSGRDLAYRVLSEFPRLGWAADKTGAAK